jgi:hypothetical protein
MFTIHVVNPLLNLPQGWFIQTITGWWLTYPSEKYESPLGLLFPIYGK